MQRQTQITSITSENRGKEERERTMDQVKKKWQFPFAVKRRVTVSLKVPVVILLVLFGLIPMILCTHATIASVRQNQI